MTHITHLPDSECSCTRCQSMCRHAPCWPTPAEANALMDAGLGQRLMLDYWTRVTTRGVEETFIVCPAQTGRETGLASCARGPCVLQDTTTGLCTLHVRGLKPIEGRKAHCSTQHSDPRNYREDLEVMWDTIEGRRTVERFRQNYYGTERPPSSSAAQTTPEGSSS